MIWKEEMPPRIWTRSFSSTWTDTVSSGSLRMISANILVGMMTSPASRTAASTSTVMPVSRLKPVICRVSSALRYNPSSAVSELFGETVLAAMLMALDSRFFSQVNFIKILLHT